MESYGRGADDIENRFTDYIGVNNIPNLLAQLDHGEKVIFSCIVIKVNKWGLNQDRTLLLTNRNLYNVKKETVKRKIQINNIKALTLSSVQGHNEFVVHIKSEYDY